MKNGWRPNGRRPNGYAASLVSWLAPRSPQAEAFRTLRTSLRYTAAAGDLRKVLVTSPAAGDGKSTVTANLAAATAQSGSRVLLMDADLRKPIQHKVFGVPNRQGLVSVLVDDLPVERLIWPTAVPGLDLLTSGPVPPNPAELLETDRMRGLLDHLARVYDHVFIDSPPVVAVTDAALLAARVDGAILVVRAGVSRQDLAAEARDVLAKAGARILGAVLNAVNLGSDDYYYYYSYGGHAENAGEG